MGVVLQINDDFCNRIYMLIVCISIDAYRLIVYMLPVTNRTNRTIYLLPIEPCGNRIESHGWLP